MSALNVLKLASQVFALLTFNDKSFESFLLMWRTYDEFKCNGGCIQHERMPGNLSFYLLRFQRRNFGVL